MNKQESAEFIAAICFIAFGLGLAVTEIIFSLGEF